MGITMENFAKEIKKELSKLELDSEDMLNEFCKEVSNSIVTRLKTGKKHGGETPEDTGEYADGWVVDDHIKTIDHVYVIKNLTKPRLTHLLEFGDKTSQAHPHIRPAMEEAIEEIRRKLK